MRVLLVTNILLRSAQPNHPLWSVATHAVAKLIRRKDEVFFCPQNVIEFWNVATRPPEKNGLGFSSEMVFQEIATIEKSIVLLPDIPTIYIAWKRIVSAHKVQGVKAHDARLVAVMNVYSVEAILTFDALDFQRFTTITVIHPSSLAS
jgi:predicted nucleic acid-binding protein